MLLLLHHGSVGGEVRDADGGALGEVQSVGQVEDAVVVGYSVLSIASAHRGCGEHAVSCLEDTNARWISGGGNDSAENRSLITF